MSIHPPSIFISGCILTTSGIRGESHPGRDAPTERQEIRGTNGVPLRVMLSGLPCPALTLYWAHYVGHPYIELAKRFIQVFLHHLTEKPR